MKLEEIQAEAQQFLHDKVESEAIVRYVLSLMRLCYHTGRFDRQQEVLNDLMDRARKAVERARTDASSGAPKES